jgi:hypothetical protein
MIKNIERGKGVWYNSELSGEKSVEEFIKR